MLKGVELALREGNNFLTMKREDGITTDIGALPSKIDDRPFGSAYTGFSTDFFDSLSKAGNLYVNSPNRKGRIINLSQGIRVPNFLEIYKNKIYVLGEYEDRGYHLTAGPIQGSGIVCVEGKNLEDSFQQLNLALANSSMLRKNIGIRDSQIQAQGDYCPIRCRCGIANHH